ncbi:MAG: YggT family protein [Deltaproteobacteria bacterium]|nr:YggT family protein [Deltaproteobacteria bacterium]
MFVIGNFLYAASVVLDYLLTFYMWLIIIRAFISWVSPDPYNPIVRFLYQVTEPALYSLRKRMPYIGGIDLSPLILILAIVFLQFFIVGTLKDLSVQLR